MVIAVLLLVDSCAGALVGRSSGRRGGDGDLGDVVSGFLSADGDIPLGYVGIGIELIEEGIAEYLGGLTDRQGAQDRILLENVQVGWNTNIWVLVRVGYSWNKSNIRIKIRLHAKNWMPGNWSKSFCMDAVGLVARPNLVKHFGKRLHVWTCALYLGQAQS